MNKNNLKKEDLIDKKLKVSHYPQVPCKSFDVEVENEYEAALLVKVLSEQHLWLYKNRFIPDYCNVISVSMYETEIDEETGKPYGWTEYYNDKLECEWEEIEEILNNN